MTFCLPETLKPVQFLIPRVGAGAATSDYVSLKNCHRAWVVVDFTEGGADTVTFSFLKATAVLPSNSTAATNVFRIWSNVDTVTSDLLVERTAAANYSNAGASSKQIIFEIDPVALGDHATAGSYDCIALYCDAPNAADYISATIWIQPRYVTRVVNSLTALTD